VLELDDAAAVALGILEGLPDLRLAALDRARPVPA